MAYDREQRNAHLFAMVRATIKDGGNNARVDEWLTELEKDANNTYPGWGDHLRGFLRGLWVAGLIDLAGIDAVEEELIRR